MSKFILCFIFDSTGGYKPVPYSFLMSADGTRNPEYASRYFLPLQGYLLEVSQEDYRDFYRTERRRRYVREQEGKTGRVSYHDLVEDHFRGKRILQDLCADVESEVIRNIMAEKLHIALQLLSDDDQRLVHMIYFENQTEAHCAEVFGVTQQAIHGRKIRILNRLRKIFEI